MLGVIPARMASTRLPGKPLRKIAGRPLIEWVWRRATAIPELEVVVVAAADSEIVEAVKAFGGRAVLTRRDHASGTDRVAEVAARAEYGAWERIVNLQGDEPFVSPEVVSGAVGCLRGGWEIGTVAVPIWEPEDWRSPAVVKVVRGTDGGALYFSRAPIPYPRDGVPRLDVGDDAYLRHVGIYAFTRAALERATALPGHRLEVLEGLEQLRWLANGLRIGVSVVQNSESGVDTEADLARAEEILKRRQEFP